MQGINTGKIIARIDARDAPKFPEFFKVRGLLVLTWYFGCFQHRPYPSCNQLGHTKTNCKKSSAPIVNTPAGGPEPGPSTSNNENQQPPTQRETSVSYALAVTSRRMLFKTKETEKEQEKGPEENEWRVKRNIMELKSFWIHGYR
ncbi:hypothetical protein ACJMK2_013382 [Sinanodonta woodiana]|uniref:Uncharacterized protein n=1 Tax=Sinanodonta woodiana TaxID=1069815 RepID=A0ABD3V0G7_SINWO